MGVSGSANHPTGGRSGAAGSGGDTGGTTGGTRAGSGGTSGEGGDSGGGGEGGEPNPVDPRAPIITIVSPDALADPSDGPVIVDDVVVVVCRAEQSSAPGSVAVNPEKVFLEVLDENGDRVGPAERQGERSGSDDEYTATFPIADIANGVVTFRCRADDVNDSALTGRGESSSFVDHGPEITIKNPEQDSVKPQRGVTRFELDVFPDPLTPDDEEAEVESVFLTVAEVDISLDDDGEGHYFADVTFTDTDVFPETPEGQVALNVTATNRRGDPGPVTRQNGYQFIVDGDGPVIEITSPGDEDVVGGRVDLLFTVEDELADVNPASIVVNVGAERHPFNDDPANWAVRSDGSYRFSFNSRLFDITVSQATIRIQAEDTAQNAARPAEILVYFDNVPPIVDLDPISVQERNSMSFCTVPFDPVGESPNDVTVLAGGAGLRKARAFVWDETNVTPELTLHHATVDQDSVYWYFLPASAGPIIEDSDDPDTVCDRMTPNAVVGANLSPVTPEGNEVYPTGMDDDPPGCLYQMASVPADFLCDFKTSDLRRVMAFDRDQTIPVIFAQGALEEPDCTGAGWAVDTFLDEGWNCMAAVASDNLGNTAVSRPLRICWDDPATTTQPTCMNLQNPPSCIEPGSTLPRNLAASGMTLFQRVN